MILKDVRNYVRDRGVVSVNDIAVHFNAAADTVRAMLAIWQRKGQVVRVTSGADCGSRCVQCDVGRSELYAWNQVGRDEVSGSCAALGKQPHLPANEG